MTIDKITDNENAELMYLQGKSMAGNTPKWLAAADEREHAGDFEKQIYESILAKIRAGGDVEASYDEVFGTGAYKQLAAEAYDQIRFSKTAAS